MLVTRDLEELLRAHCCAAEVRSGSCMQQGCVDSLEMRFFLFCHKDVRGWFECIYWMFIHRVAEPMLTPIFAR